MTEGNGRGKKWVMGIGYVTMVCKKCGRGYEAGHICLTSPPRSKPASS